jgi:hypothetical protein
MSRKHVVYISEDALLPGTRDLLRSMGYEVAPVGDVKDVNDGGLTLRETAAVAAMQGMIRRGLLAGDVAANAVIYADALVAELNRPKIDIH